MSALSMDARTMKEKKIEFYRKKMGKLKRGHSGIFNSSLTVDDIFNKEIQDEQGVENDILLEFQKDIQKQIKLTKSKASFDFDEVVSFYYGPFTSRFWLMRKHMNQLSTRDLTQKAPFHAWDCITINLRNKGDVYLIIKNEKILSMFLKLLIYELQTIDGQRGTALPLIHKGIRRQMAQYGYVDESKQQEYENRIRHQIMTRVWFSYALTRTKLKLSFSSLVKKKTIFELWGHQIIVSFRFLRDSGQIKCQLTGDEERKIFHFIMHGINDFCLKQLIQNRLKHEETTKNQQKKARIDKQIL